MCGAACRVLGRRGCVTLDNRPAVYLSLWRGEVLPDALRIERLHGVQSFCPCIVYGERSFSSVPTGRSSIQRGTELLCVATVVFRESS